MSSDLTTKLLASLTAVIGALAVVFAFLDEFGVDLSEGQRAAISGLGGLVLVVAGIWLHPSVPVGVKDGG